MHFCKHEDTYHGDYITGPTYLRIGVCFGDDATLEPVVTIYPCDLDPRPDAHDPNRYLERARQGVERANQETNGDLVIASLNIYPSETPSVAGQAEILAYHIALGVLTGKDFPPMINSQESAPEV